MARRTMLFENVRAAVGVAALGGVVAAFGGAGGWLTARGAVGVLLGAAVLGAVLLVVGRRARRARAAGEPPERVWRRADGPWPAYDRRRSAAGEPATPEPHRDRQPTE